LPDRTTPAPGTSRRARGLGLVLTAALAASTAVPPGVAARSVEVLRAVGGLPPHIVGRFREPLGFQQAPGGVYYVFDRRGHSVYRVEPDRSEATLIVQIGHEEGRIIDPTAFDLEPGGASFVVADGANRQERVQIFGPAGLRTGGFTLPGRATVRITIGSLALGGVATLQYSGRSVLINQPETGALVTEYGLSGSAVRTFGAPRATGQERDREVHLALNVGLPLINPQGGYYFIFQSGEPILRRYDAAGGLMFERHIEGREIDALVKAQPTTWPRRRVGDNPDVPLVPPLVRAAAVDHDGSVWISFVVPYTYVYDQDGDKIRSVQFQAAGVIAPNSLHFPSPGRLLVTPGCYEFRTSK
jgi:hypothetical protein